jgi:chromosome segregation ATPase
MAVTMAITVAYVSVNGLLKVFTGAGTIGLILFSSIEIAKIVATSAIHTYGRTIGWFYSLLLSICILISMAITSMGIYGFLSSTYKESFSKMENTDSRLELIGSKSENYKTQLLSKNTEKESLNNQISELSKGLSNGVQYKDKQTGQILTTTISNSSRKSFEKRLDIATNRLDKLNEEIEELNNKIFELDNEGLGLKLENTSGELGPLKYLADVAGTDMDNVMKWFILLLIIIGDPMAVLMVIIFNKVANFEKESSNKKEKTKVDIREVIRKKLLPRSDNKQKEVIEDVQESDMFTEREQEEKMNIEDIQEEIEDIQEEIEDTQEEIEEIKEEIEDIQEEIEDTQEEIEEIKEEIEDIQDEITESLKENTEIDDELLQRLKELEEKELELKNKEEDIKRLDDEIKTWENTHWKLKRNKKPPSAIE